MVKFSKELEAQLIPEWREAFVNYWKLKKQIKKIKESKGKNEPTEVLLCDEFGCSIFDPLRSFACKLLHQTTTVEIIQVKSRRMEDEDGGEVYQTELLELFDQEDGMRSFFEKLDDELNKVNRFYLSKEAEFMERGEMLRKQLKILLDLKQALDHTNHRRHRQSSSSSRSSSFSERRSNSATEQSTAIMSDPGETEDNGITSASGVLSMGKNGRPKLAVRLEIPDTNPARVLGAAASMLWENQVRKSKKESSGDQQNRFRKKVQCAEKMIRSALMELYRALGLLKIYSSLNMVAFIKILKKFDKVAKQQSSATYLRTVKRSHFVCSDKVVRLMDEVESIFITHFANHDRKKAMKFLRPRQRKESHTVTFFSGLSTGCFVTLFIFYAVLIHITGLYKTNYTGYVEIVYPVFSVFALFSLHLFMYGCNLFAWKKVRINYNFIFEFQSCSSLTHRDAFLICATTMTTVVAAMAFHLLLLAHDWSRYYVDAIPGCLLLIFMALIVCPFKIIYRSTRYCFLRVMRNIICSPWYKVVMVDFFMADQLTSQIPLLRYMESSACYFMAGILQRKPLETCNSGRFYIEISYLISFLPYYFRTMQCARRWHDEGDLNHLANMGKYVSAMVAAGVRLSYSRKQESYVLLGLVLATSVIATLYQLYWDFVKDWGFFEKKSRYRFLRENLILKTKFIYYLSMILNVLLRVVWIQTVLRVRISVVESRMVEFLMASLEVIRRGHWNFYRLENEHLNNCGKFRAVKSVPLPFRDTDSD